MAEAKRVQFSLKVVMIKGRNKVLYAEIDSDFADVVLSFLTLPLGTIARLFIKHYGNTPILGCFNSLYSGLLYLDSSHFGTVEGKKMLLDPRNASVFECRRLKLQIDDSPRIKYFKCPRGKCLSVYYQMKCLCHERSTNEEIWNYSKYFSQRQDHKGVFTSGTTSFILTDDLEILINSPASIVRVLKRNFIEDTNVLEEKPLIVGLKEIMELLKASLVSKTPITDFVVPRMCSAATLDGRRKCIAPAKYESDALPRTQTSQNISSDSKKFTVKVFVQKSTCRVVLAQSRHDFVDFLFSLLTIPLGRVQFLLGDKDCLGSIRNLYRSISNPETVKYMKSKEAITRLLEPELPLLYLSLHQIFSLEEQLPPSRYKVKSMILPVGMYDMNWIDPKGKGSFVKEVPRALFVVSDDLVVSTPSSTSIISTLNKMQIPISDIEERELHIDSHRHSCYPNLNLRKLPNLCNSIFKSKYLSTHVRTVHHVEKTHRTSVWKRLPQFLHCDSHYVNNRSTEKTTSQWRYLIHELLNVLQSWIDPIMLSGKLGCVSTSNRLIKRHGSVCYKAEIHQGELMEKEIFSSNQKRTGMPMRLLLRI
ncbi:uncharacterized protein [Henckelia pumila]|uniref:uncharacterized protein n=1 Tax=Henckelia pumila TaxID=405737 RepID=UPI003C6DDDFB